MGPSVRSDQGKDLSPHEEALRDLKHRTESFVRSFGIQVKRIGAGRRWEPLEDYISRLFGILLHLESVACGDGCEWERGGVHSESCPTFRYAILRAEAARLDLLPAPRDPI